MKEVKIHDCTTDSTIFNLKKWVKHEDHIKFTDDLKKENEELKQMYQEIYDNSEFRDGFPSDKCLKHFHFYNDLKKDD
jgi:hypothetical protein